MITVPSTINLSSQTVPPIIPVVQGDTGRSIQFTLADFTIPQGSTATYYVQKPSGEAVYNAATIDGNTVLVELTAQSIIEAGDNYGQVRIENDGEVVTSFDFILLVKPFRGIDATQSTTEMNIFDKAVEQAEEAIDEAKVEALEEIAEAGSGNIAEEFASTNSYLAGEYTIYQAKLYRFTSNHTGAWSGSDAEEITVGDALTDLEEEQTSLKEDFDSAIALPNNLMDVANSTVGYELTNYATTTANQSYSVSEYIPIAEGQEYTFGLGTGDLGRISFYQTADTSKPCCLSTSDWMSGKVPSAVASAVDWFTVNENNTMSFTVPSGYTDRQGRSIKYMRFTYWTSQADKAFCVKGTTLIDDVSFLGKVPYIDEELDAIYEQIPSQDAVVDCLGDSHTAGVGSFTSYPSVLSGLVGSAYSVRNFGAGGDGASDIVARQGALYAVCDPVTIADSQSYTNNVPLKLYSGDSLRQFGSKWIGINKDAMTGNLNCLLGDRPVYVSFDSTNRFRIRPTSTGGGDIVVTRPTKITTTYMQTDFKSHVLVLCMGSNEAESLTMQKLADWNRLIAKQYTRYIVVAEPTLLSASNRETYNELMYAYFGTHFIDIHDYMIKYGLQDEGITPTSADETAIAQGKTPPSLMYDSVHYNQSGINVMANQIYKKGVELRYWG